MREKVGKSRNTVFFQWFGAPEGRKVGSLKRRVRSQLARWEMKNCTPLWREARFQVKMHNTPGADHFWQLRCGKVHAVVARSTFGSQNAQNTSVSDDFWKLRCRKSARRCGAKHIYITLHYTPLHYAPLHYTTLHNTTTTTTQLHSTTLNYTTLHYTALHYTEWHCTTDRQVDR